jgi:hypothetical protein
VGRPDGKRPLGTPRHIWDNNIKMYLQEMGWGHSLNSIGLEKGQVSGVCECGNEPSRSIKSREFLEWLKNS